MAFHGSAAPAKGGMKDQTSTNIARDGAAKRPQKSFATTYSMRSRIGDVQTGVPSMVGDRAPDASSPNPLDPTSPGKKFGQVATKWGMKDPMGNSINGNGPKVLSEGALTGR